MGNVITQNPLVLAGRADFARKEKCVLEMITGSLHESYDCPEHVQSYNFLHPFYIGSMDTAYDDPSLLALSWITDVSGWVIGVAMDKWGFSRIKSPKPADIFSHIVDDHVMFKQYIDGLHTSQGVLGETAFNGTRESSADITIRGVYGSNQARASFVLHEHPSSEFEFDMARSTYHDLVDKLVQLEKRPD